MGWMATITGLCGRPAVASGSDRLASPGTQRRDTIIGLLIVLVVAAGFIVASVFIVRAAQDFFTSASPQLGSAVIGTGGLVFVAVIANFGTKIYERRQQIQEEQRAKKAEVYSEFMAFWFRLLTGNEAGKEDAPQENGKSSDGDEAKKEGELPAFQNEVEAYLRGFTHQLVAWGSERFIREYVVFKQKITHDTGDALLNFEKVLLEIRRDLGYKNKGLNRGDLLKVFLEDPGVDALIMAEGKDGT